MTILFTMSGYSINIGRVSGLEHCSTVLLGQVTGHPEKEGEDREGPDSEGTRQSWVDVKCGARKVHVGGPDKPVWLIAGFGRGPWRGGHILWGLQLPHLPLPDLDLIT